ncbi:TPA: beta family protein [Yersinia enterocolitica]
MNDISYIPILKTKRAEYAALNQLDKVIKAKIIPMLELEPVPIDPESDIPEKSYTDFLNGFEQKLTAGCSDFSTIFLDGLLVEEQFITQGDTYPIVNAVDQARNAGFNVVPVSSPTRSTTYHKEIYSLLQGEICLRLTTIDLVNPQLIISYITQLNIPLNKIDIMIDLRDTLTADGITSGNNKTLALGLINNLPNVHQYRSLTLAAGSFPVDLSDISVGIYSQNRLEWELWQSVYSSNQLVRHVIYSDYGVQHPEYPRLTTKFPSATASVRYTGDTNFWVFRGRIARRYGFDQYGAHSQSIINHQEYSGTTFSIGDNDINDYASTYSQYLQNPQGNYKFGSPEVWRRIGQNHHITKVVEQLANLYGL